MKKAIALVRFAVTTLFEMRLTMLKSLQLLAGCFSKFACHQSNYALLFGVCNNVFEPTVPGRAAKMSMVNIKQKPNESQFVCVNSKNSCVACVRPSISAGEV